ncbi:two-component sensor histidine kinase [Gracilibacillus boraciitolerans JCM 21714]|uniref:Two-component sensor histidine kinase n=1 Tax=Gracilibacillus boraciitolerans JCM 21714 TaxID=1298598 RepID=W4VJW0_9BACI|nr:histidine kinase [Gracilibacillus boraciitolerans]GAE93113.1 two-component sensor histidine kinase [Gracilibacillus boraciitolerans JCM 21714]
MYSLAKLKDYELIKELTLSLIKYFQFVFRNKSTFVSLKDEVGHTTNYLKIQELRYLNQFSYTIIVPTYLEDTRIPPLLILTFVENAVKHAVSLDEEIQINVEVKIIEKKDAPPFLNINIVDTGVGFSEELLTKLNSHQTIVNEQGEHTGIWNIDRRLTLLYDGHAYLEFRNNQPSGAIVEVFIPLS